MAGAVFCGLSMSGNDASGGWDAVADRFASLRSDVGADVVLRWARNLPSGAAVLDIGCGTGLPIGRALVSAGVRVYGIEPSAKLLAMFHRNLPQAMAMQEPVETSRFFGRTFDGIVAIGVLFLWEPDRQSAALSRMASALRPGGQLLFGAPRQACCWTDSLTGCLSQSLGLEGYERILAGAGCNLAGTETDQGGNHYFHARRSFDRV